MASDDNFADALAGQLAQLDTRSPEERWRDISRLEGFEPAKEVMNLPEIMLLMIKLCQDDVACLKTINGVTPLCDEKATPLLWRNNSGAANLLVHLQNAIRRARGVEARTKSLSRKAHCTQLMERLDIDIDDPRMLPALQPITLPKLQHLSLLVDELYDEGPIDISHFFVRTLKTLTLGEAPYLIDRELEDTVKILDIKCPLLEIIKMRAYRSLPPMNSISLLMGVTAFRTFEVGPPIAQPLPTGLLVILAGNKRLRCVRLEGIRLGYFDGFDYLVYMNGEILFPNVEHLAIHGTESELVLMLPRISTNIMQLHIEVTRFNTLAAGHFSALLHRFPRLLGLVLRLPPDGTSTLGMLAILPPLPELLWLEILSADDMSLHACGHDFDWLAFLKRFPKLRYLKIQTTYTIELSDALVDACPDLNLIDSGPMQRGGNLLDHWPEPDRYPHHMPGKSGRPDYGITLSTGTKTLPFKGKRHDHPRQIELMRYLDEGYEAARSRLLS